MLAGYLDAAMRHAEYKKLEDGTWFGQIPGLQGVWANGATVESDAGRPRRENC